MSTAAVSEMQAVADELECKPSLAPHVRVREQRIRNRRWAIVQNTVSGQFLRIDAGLWQALTRLQGQCSLRDWLTRHEPLFDSKSLLESVAHLQRLGVLQGMQPGQATARAGRRAAFNPLMLKLPLCNPSRLLAYLARLVGVVSARTAVLTILALFGLAAVLAMLNSAELLRDWNRVLSAPEQWWQYLLLYPCLKCLHELSHGLVLQRLGGDVREAGISLLVLMPVPYVNATDAWSLPRRRDRLAVTAAGMLCDLSLASVALILWYTLESSVLTDMAFAVMLLGFVSVVLFNANPLLKFDGYYLLEDLLDSPGLARRSLAYWQYLFKRYLLAADGITRPLMAEGERRWLLPYALASLVYRLSISLVIAVFLVTRFHEVGLLLALFSIVPMFIRPLPRLAAYLAISSQLQGHRLRATARLGLLVLLLVLPVMLLPLPSSTRAEGIVWSPEQSEVFVAESGEISEWQVRDGEAVVAGQLLVHLLAPELEVERRRQESAMAQLLLEHAAQRQNLPQHAAVTRVEIERRQELLDALQQRIASLRVVAPRDGHVAFTRNRLLNGQRVLQGDLLLYVVGDEPVVVKAVVDQRQLGKLQTGVRQAQVRFSDDIATVVPAVLSRQIPAGNNRLPSMALADNGFGGIAVESGQGELQTLEEIFHLELTPDEQIRAADHGGLGGRAYITLKHPPETLGARWWRSSRQLLLKHLGA
ncbi:HlyD family efflux transporter periplasmic adaptor subunit [Granulosicoccus sp. 3-233]